MTEQELRGEICRIGRSLFERGYAHATAGNISVRLPDGYLITPTDACLGLLDPERLARLDADGRQIGGDRASKTIVLHRRIYAATAANGHEAGCIIHTHSTSLVACSLKAFEQGSQPDASAELLPPITPYFVMKVGRVPHIAYHRPGSDEAAEAVAKAIAHHASQGRHLRAVMLARLGPNVWHDTPASAMAVLEELEETAKLSLLAQPAPLDDAQIDELRRVFGAIW
jgi:3-dehydro-4-phosphotetronate decarboxylase